MTIYSYFAVFLDFIVDPDRPPVVVDVPIWENQLFGPIILCGTGLFALCAVIF